MVTTLTDTPPQSFLDDLHAAQVPALFDPTLSARQRANLTRQSKERLGQTMARLGQQIKSIQNRYDPKREAEDLKRALRPYTLLYDLGKELNEAVTRLEEALASGKVLPEGFMFGDVIFGRADKGEWYLGDADDYHLYQHMQQTQQRYNTLMQQREPLVKQIKRLESQTQHLKEELNEVTRQYKKRLKSGYLMRRVLAVIVLALVIAGGGGLAYLATQNHLTLIAVGVGALTLLLIPVIRRRYQRKKAVLYEAVQLGKHEMQTLKRQMDDVRRQYVPLNESAKEYRAEYKNLRQHFPPMTENA